MSITGVSTSSQSIKDDYLKLLSAQLSHQNPLEPMDNGDMTSQLSALSELEQMEMLNVNFNSLLHNFNLAEGAAFIGKEVSYFREGEENATTGVVSEVKIIDSEPKLVVGGDNVALDEVVSVVEV